MFTFQGMLKKIRQRSSRRIPVLTYEGYASRLNFLEAWLDGIFQRTRSSYVQIHESWICS